MKSELGPALRGAFFLLAYRGLSLRVAPAGSNRLLRFTTLSFYQPFSRVKPLRLGCKQFGGEARCALTRCAFGRYHSLAAKLHKGRSKIKPSKLTWLTFARAASGRYTVHSKSPKKRAQTAL